MTLIEQEFEDTLAIVRRGGSDVVFVADKMPRIRSVGHHPADVVPIRGAVRDQLGLETIVLDCRGVNLVDGLARRLLTLESLDDGAHLNWMGPHATALEPFEADALPEWFREGAQQSRPPDGRDWTLPGWWTQATAWITDSVQTNGVDRVLATEQIRTWEFSCVVRVQTDQQDLYFKALPRSYGRELRLARFLADCHPTLVPGVVATNESQRWLLMRACQGHCLEDGAPVGAWERAAAGYAALQVASAAQVEHLERLGCPVRGPLELRTRIGPLLADETALLGTDEHALSLDELSRLRRLRPNLENACEELAHGDIPLALEHGDLWSSNVYVNDNGVQFIDWTDASVSHPFFSLMPLLESARWDMDPAAVPALQARIIDRYLEHWTTYSTRERLRRALALARPLAALHIATTYWRDTPQPHRQWWMPRMVPFFVRIALEQWDATAPDR